MMRYFRKLGKSLILPVSVMPAAAILIGIGHWIEPGQGNAIASFLINAGVAITDNLPILFAVGISYGMSKDNDGVTALSGVVSYLIITSLLSVESVAMIKGIPIANVDTAFETITNAFIGIIAGLVASGCYNQFSHVQLPKGLAFFSGKRLVPIVSSMVMIVISLIFFFVWPILYNGLVYFGQSISNMGPLGAGLYAFFNRLLIPTGLHHALNSVFWFDVASINDVGKFWGTVGGGVKGVTGMYQAGFFPIMMFGLPGAALAMHQCARSERKKQIASLMLAVGFASFFTGITEPLEFSFMFVAPFLYLLHAFLTGVFVFIAASLEWIAGFSFSAGLVDYLLSINMPFASNVLMLIPLGIVCGFLYYVTFRFFILKFNLMTPGREEEENKNILDITIDKDDFSQHYSQSKFQHMASIIYYAVGGKENILDVESCITRLRLELKDTYSIDEEVINTLGTSGMIRLGKHDVQIIIGPEVQFIVDEMIKLLGG